MNFNYASGQRRIRALAFALHYGANNFHYKLRADLVGRFSHCIGKQYLNESGPVAQIYKHHLAQTAMVMHPALEFHFLADELWRFDSERALH